MKDPRHIKNKISTIKKSFHCSQIIVSESSKAFRQSLSLFGDWFAPFSINDNEIVIFLTILQELFTFTKIFYLPNFNHLLLSLKYLIE